MLAEQVAARDAEMRAALDDPDPWRAVRTIHRFSERQVRDRGLNDVLLGSHAAGLAFGEQRRAHARGLERLVERARSAGVVRPEVSVEDVRVGLLAIASFRALPPERARTGTGQRADTGTGVIRVWMATAAAPRAHSSNGSGRRISSHSPAAANARAANVSRTSAWYSS